MSKTFIVTTKHDGTVQNHRVVASSDQEARQSVGTSDPILAVKQVSKLRRDRPLNRFQRITLFRRLAMMTRSGIGIAQSLKEIRSSFKGPISRCSNDLLSIVQEGRDLDSALSDLPADFPPNTVSLIRSGMHGGEIHKALENTADFEYEMHTIGMSARGGLIGAGIEFLIAIVLIVGTAEYAAPRALESPIYQAAEESVNIEWAFVTADVMSYLTIGIAILLLGLFLIAYVFKPFVPNFSDSVTLKIPVFRDLVLSKNYYSVFYGLSLLLRSGVPIKDALSLSHKGSPSGAIAEDLKNAVEAVENGEDWGEKMTQLHQTDRACLSTSQDYQDISKAFNAVAMSHRDLYKQRVDQVVPALRAISNLFMFIAGFLIFAMMMMPSMQATRGLLQ